MTQVSVMSASNVNAAAAPLDPTEALAAAALALGQLDAGSARQRADALAAERDVALKKAADALDRAQKARQDCGFFSQWGSALKGVAVVASAAVAVASCGAGAPALVSVLAVSAAGCSVGSYAMKETGLDGKLCKLEVFGKEFQLDWSDAVALAGIAASGAGAFVSGSETAAQASAAGEHACAQEASTVAPAAGNWASEACRVAIPVAYGTAASATAGRAYFAVRAGLANSDAVKDEADEKEASNQVDLVKSRTEDAIADLKTVQQTQSKIVEIVSSLVEEQSQAQNLALSRRA